MNKDFSKAWISSTQPRKQRKYRFNAPLHILGKFLNVALSKDLRKKYGKRSLRVKKGDRVKIMRGDFKGKVQKVDRINVKETKVYLEGIEISKKDGSKTTRPFNPSKLMITELDTNDKMRMKKLKTEKVKS